MTKVLCNNCDHIVRREFCAVKNIKVARKKPLECSDFAPKTERGPVEPVYVPTLDKKTTRLLRRLIRSGALQAGPNEEIQITSEGEVFQKARFEVPATSATAGILDVATSASENSALGSYVTEDTAVLVGENVQPDRD